MNPRQEHHLAQRQTQGLVLTPQLRQSLRILQAPTADLRQEIAAEIAANPLLEEIPPEESTPATDPEAEENPGAEDTFHESDDAQPADATLIALTDDQHDTLQKIHDDYYDNSRDHPSPTTHDDPDADTRRQHFFDSLTTQPSLQEHLLNQARLATANPRHLSALQTLIGHLDDRGYLTADLGHLTLQTTHTRADLDAALAHLKTFDPPGIGAADLRECLLLQLFHNNQRHTLAALILDECYPLLLKRRIPEIARTLGTTPGAVHAALATLAKLDTAPARQYAQETNPTILPDITIQRDPNPPHGWQVHLNTEILPRLRLNHTYKNLLAGQTLTHADREYISEKIRSGRFLIGAIEQRQQTLERIAHLLLKYQTDFFEHGPTRLHPLVMAQLASDLEVHETTISRALSGKYIQTPHGLYELRYFFTSGVTTDTGETVANTSIKEFLAEIIAREDPATPLSDEALTEALKQKGIRIARRTVAKYRDTLSIPPAHLRRRHMS